MKEKLTGLGVAIVTPFREDGSVDFPALGRLLDHLLAGGVQYFVVLGTTGEAVTLSTDEKKAVVDFVAEHTEHRLPIVVGMGGNNTHHVIDLIREFDFEHIDAILSVAPYYNKPTPRGLFEHYRTISSTSPVPVVLYNVPGRTGVNIPASVTVELAHACENIVAVKEASGNLMQIMQIAAEKPEDFLIISGDDGLIIPVMAVGGAGVISVAANAYPAEFRRITDAALAGDYAAANREHFRFLELIRLLFADGNPGGIKAVLSEMKIIENNLRLPLVRVNEKVADAIRNEIKRLERLDR
jgi:4-hydroxy-tetrahydrodipicolinate synthase